MKKLFFALILFSTTAFANTSAFCAQQYSFAIQNYGVAISQGGMDANFIQAAQKPGSKRFICQCQKHHAGYMSNIIDNRQRAFMTGTLFVGNPPQSLKGLVCK